jgi:hypothetical protein
VWSSVERVAFGDPPDYSRWSWTAERPGLMTFARGGAERWTNDRGDLAGVAEALYGELARATGARVLVDESKSPLFGYFVACQPWAEVLPIRLVRDPRCTAASWSRPKQYPGMLGGQFPTHPPQVSAVNWMKRVALADRLLKDRGPVLRFEDFVEDPVRAASDLLTSIGVDAPAPPSLQRGAVDFGVNHILASNPDKFERGEIEIRPTSHDAHIPRHSAAVVTAMTLPLLRRYGYPIRSTT